MYRLENQKQENHNLSFMWAYRIVGIMLEKGILTPSKGYGKTALFIRNDIEHAVYEADVPRQYIGFHHVEAALRAYGVEMKKAEKLRYDSLKVKLKKSYDISEEIKELYEELGHIW
jgi:hypothetical protein